jgi:hypothetical protein
VQRIKDYIEGEPKPDAFTEAELDWAYAAHRRATRAILICISLSTPLGVGVLIYVFGHPAVCIAGGVFFLGYYALFFRTMLRKVAEAVEKRRAELRAFLATHPERP